MNFSSVLAGRFSFLLFLLSTLIPLAAWGEVTHIVRPGESLSVIAKKYHLSIDRLREANDLENSNLRIGQRLSIPLETAGAEKARALEKGKATDPEQEGGDPETHVVKKGETLGQIARRYRLSAEELREINGLKGNHLKIGRVLDLKATEEIAGEGENREDEAENSEGSAVVSLREGFFPEEKDQQLLVRVAKSFLGAKYKRGGNGINGMDCSSFVQKVFRIFEVDLPRTAREQFQVGYEVTRNALQMGDLVFFKRSKAQRPTHVGIYIGNNQFVHASVRKRQVDVESLETRYFAARFIGAKRIGRVPEQFSRKEPDRN
jgi:peptidoglycan DL-endopeptidase LytE